MIKRLEILVRYWIAWLNFYNKINEINGERYVFITCTYNDAT